MISVLIVDDEPLARSRLHRFLANREDIQVVSEAEDGASALQKAEDLQPNLVFLDIQMPGLTGLQVASALVHFENAPLLVFLTGYSEHALDAFERGALDYLLKPVSQERLDVTLGRVRERLADREARSQAQEQVRAQTEQSAGQLRSLPIRADYAVRFLPFDKILYLFARDKKVYAHSADGEEERTYYTLTQLEKLLPADRFLRIHDSSLVNLDAVTELLFLGDHTYEVRLVNRQRLRVGRTRYMELQNRLGLNNPRTA